MTMQMWSSHETSFVNLVDGYAHLPFLGEGFLAHSYEGLYSCEMSTLMHEFTHHMCLQGPLGLLCTYHVAANIAARRFAQLEADISSPDRDALWPHGRPFEEMLLKANELSEEAAAIYVRKYTEHLRVLVNLTTGLRWLFEGLAMFCQLDYIPSSKSSEASSKLWEFMTALVIRELHPQDIVAKGNKLATRIRDAFSGMVSVQQKLSLKWSLLSNTDSHLDAYFTGYLLVKGLQQRLTEKDYRLSDPEIYLTFLIGYFFNDLQLLDLCVPCSLHAPNRDIDYALQEEIIQWRLKEHIQKSLECLIYADTPRLHAVLDHITSPNEYETNFHIIDYSAALRGEGIHDVPAEELARDLRRILDHNIYRMAEQLRQLYPNFAPGGNFEGVPIEDIPIAEVRIAYIMVEAAFMFRTLINLNAVLKLVETKPIFVGYALETEFITILWVSPDNTFFRVEYGRLEHYSELLSQFQREHGYVVNLGEQGIDPYDDSPTGRAAIAQVIQEVLASPHRKGVWHFLIYDMAGRQMVDIIARDDFRRLASYYAKGHVQVPVKNLKGLEEISSFLDRETYSQVIMMDVPKADDIIEAMSEVEKDILEIAWRRVFPEAVASRKTLESFWTHKMKDILPDRASKALVWKLCNDDVVEVAGDPSTIEAIVARVNERWIRRVGRPLITVIHLYHNRSRLQLTLSPMEA